MAGQPTHPNVLPPEIRPYQKFITIYEPLGSLNKALLNPYFWGQYVRGGRLISHDETNKKNKNPGKPAFL